MVTPSRTSNLRRSARANWLHSSSSVHSTTTPLNAITSRATPAETVVTMTMNAARPMTHPDSRWMTASQVRADTTARSAVTGSPAHAAADLMSAAAICRSPSRLSALPGLAPRLQLGLADLKVGEGQCGCPYHLPPDAP